MRAILPVAIGSRQNRGNMNTTFLAPHIGNVLPWLYADSGYWTCIGLFGNALFSSRFIIQWIMSERLKRVVVPPIFWQLSFWGSVVSLLYALHVDKLPIVLSYVFVPVIYFRNLRILKKNGVAGTKT